MSVFSLFQYLSLVHSVVRKTIANGLRPGNPENAGVIEHLSSLWELVRVCWAEDRTRRPLIHELVEVIRDAVVRRETIIPTSTPPDGESGLARVQSGTREIPPSSDRGPRVTRAHWEVMELCRHAE